MVPELLQQLEQKYPFLSVCIYAGNEYIGIVQNRDDAITTIYDFGSLINGDEKAQYLEMANIWWWESNRSIPINIFLKTEWEPFRKCLRTFSNRDLEIVHGPICSLREIVAKKSKRRSITLVRKTD